MDSSPVTYAFPYKKASQISVEPFLHGDFYFQGLLRPPRMQTAQAQKQGDSFLSSCLAFFSITGYRAFREEHGVGNPINPCPIIILI